MRVGEWWRQNHSAATPESESQRIRGTLGSLGEAGVSIESHHFLRGIAVTGSHGIQYHYHCERNHQGKANRLLFPSGRADAWRKGRNIVCRQRLGGLLKYYERAA